MKGERMKGLLLKELYVAVRYCRLSFLIDLIFIGVSFFAGKDYAFLLFPVILLTGVIPITLLSLDEKSKWRKYSGSLPYSRAQLVSAKYLFGLIVQAITAGVVFIALVVRINAMGGLTLTEAGYVIGTLSLISVVLPAFNLPLCFGLGVEIGRNVYFVTICVLSAVIWQIISRVGLPEITPAFMWIAVAIVAVIYALSWLISIAVYGKRKVKD